MHLLRCFMCFLCVFYTVLCVFYIVFYVSFTSFYVFSQLFSIYRAGPVPQQDDAAAGRDGAVMSGVGTAGHQPQPLRQRSFRRLLPQQVKAPCRD